MQTTAINRTTRNRMGLPLTELSTQAARERLLDLLPFWYSHNPLVQAQVLASSMRT